MQQLFETRRRAGSLVGVGSGATGAVGRQCKNCGHIIYCGRTLWKTQWCRPQEVFPPLYLLRAGSYVSFCWLNNKWIFMNFKTRPSQAHFVKTGLVLYKQVRFAHGYLFALVMEIVMTCYCSCQCWKVDRLTTMTIEHQHHQDHDQHLYSRSSQLPSSSASSSWPWSAWWWWVCAGKLCGCRLTSHTDSSCSWSLPTYPNCLLLCQKLWVEHREKIEKLLYLWNLSLSPP